jgi:aminoglycoside phosphotransferase (APT) family kinase protein
LAAPSGVGVLRRAALRESASESGEGVLALASDEASRHLLVRAGRLSAVIDFGFSGVGDPACDLTIAWTLLSGECREAFCAALPFDGATWARGRGWALWKALITLAEHIDTNPLEAERARRTVDEVLADHGRVA